MASEGSSPKNGVEKKVQFLGGGVSALFSSKKTSCEFNLTACLLFI